MSTDGRRKCKYFGYNVIVSALFSLGTSSYFLSFCSSRQPVFFLRLAHLPEASLLTLDGLLGRDRIRNGSQWCVHIAWRGSSIADPTIPCKSTQPRPPRSTHTHASCLELTNREMMMWWEVHYRKGFNPSSSIHTGWDDGWLTAPKVQDSWRMYDLHKVCVCVSVCEHGSMMATPFRKSYGKQISLLWSCRNSFSASSFICSSLFLSHSLFLGRLFCLLTPRSRWFTHCRLIQCWHLDCTLSLPLE